MLKDEEEEEEKHIEHGPRWGEYTVLRNNVKDETYLGQKY